jgi:hypothetical protein
VIKDLSPCDVLVQLQRHRGYKDWRIRPHWREANLWVAEYSTYIGRGDKKGWRVLRDEKEQYRTFRTPELAYMALAKQQAEWRSELGEHDQTFKVVIPICGLSCHFEMREIRHRPNKL